ncbi:LmeA family phospholipid-binding protein [Tsukamurella soli]|uniref:LmeA family phospholipid-binding protein n=1 Tax=Tsukamurella soli TaxID=644556 RepID=UPI00360D4968
MAVLVIVLVGSELWFRHSSTSCISKMVKNATGADASVSLSKEPVLIQYFSGTAPSIDIDIKDDLNNTPGLSARLHLTNVEVNSPNTIGSATVQGSMSADGILSRVKSVPLIGDPKVQLDSAAGDIDITGTMLFAPLELQLKPEMVDNKLQLTASKVSMMGFGVPDNLAQQVIDAVSGQLPTPKGLTLNSVQVTDNAVNVVYSGHNVTPADIASGGTGNSVGNCSV